MQVKTYVELLRGRNESSTITEQRGTLEYLKKKLPGNTKTKVKDFSLFSKTSKEVWLKLATINQSKGSASQKEASTQLPNHKIRVKGDEYAFKSYALKATKKIQ